MAELSSTPIERSRKAFAAVLRAMEANGTARNLAQILGTSETTISRTKTEKLEDAITLITHLGFRIVSESKVCVDRKIYEALATIASKAMSQPETAQQLIWDEGSHS